MRFFDVSRAYAILDLDLQKAFDQVPHDKLFIKMRMVGITEPFRSGSELATG